MVKDSHTGLSTTENKAAIKKTPVENGPVALYSGEHYLVEVVPCDHFTPVGKGTAAKLKLMNHGSGTLTPKDGVLPEGHEKVTYTVPEEDEDASAEDHPLGIEHCPPATGNEMKVAPSCAFVNAAGDGS